MPQATSAASLSKLNIFWHYLRFLRLKTASYATIRKFQKRQLSLLKRDVLPLSPLYKRWAHEGLDFPSVNKATLMSHFEEWNTVGLSSEEAFELAMKMEETRDFSAEWRELTVGLSSGTSGKRGIFIASKIEREMWAAAILAKCLPGSILGHHRIALFLRAGSTLYEAVGGRRLRFQFFDLMRPFDELVRQLIVFNPTMLVAPATVLRLLVRAGVHHKVHPRRVVHVAEMLYPDVEMELTNAFQQPIHQIYQATEGFIGFSCESNKLHLNEDLMVIDEFPVEAEAHDLNAGKRFYPVITDFTRISQPIVRYRLDDILREEKSGGLVVCSCGSSLRRVAAIEGRADDLIWLRSDSEKEALIPLFADLVVRAILNSCPYLDDFQVVQHKGMEIEIKLPVVEGREPTVEVRASLEYLVRQKSAMMPKLIFSDFVVDVNLARKRRRVVSLVVVEA